MKNLTCIVCPNGCSISIDKSIDGDWIVEGNRCPKGKKFAIEEMTNPVRSICTTVKTNFKYFPRLPVKTNGEIPLNLIFKVMEEVNKVTVNKFVYNGEVILKNILDTGVDVISSVDMYSCLLDEQSLMEESE